MFNAIKGLAGGQKGQKQYDDLEALIKTARDERTALTALLKQLAGRSAPLTDTSQALEKVDAKVAAAITSIDALARRTEDLERRAAAVGDVEGRVQALMAAGATAQRQPEEPVAPGDGPERPSEQSTAAITSTRDSVDHAVALRGELEQLRGATGQLTRDIAAIRDASREADDNAFSAAEAVKEMEGRLARIETLRELSDTIEEKLTSVNALAEHVNQKTRALEAQKHVIDRAVVETNRLNEMVWNMDTQMSKLNDWLQQAESTEEGLGNLRTSFQALLAQAGELGRKQASLETRQEELAQAQNMPAAAPSPDAESLRQSRSDLEDLRNEIQDFRRAYADAAQLNDRLAADRAALEAFDDRVSSLRERMPELEATMEAILARMGQIDEGMRQATRLNDVAMELPNQLARVNERIQFVDVLEGRLNALQSLASEVDQKLDLQLARRAELDALGAQCDGVITHMADAMQQIDALAAAQDRILPMEGQLGALQDRLEGTAEELRRSETLMASQESRLVELADASRALAEEAAGRMRALHALTEELARSGSVGDRLVDELARVQRSQRDAVAQTESVEATVAEAIRRFDEIEQKITALLERAVVSGMRADLDRLNQTG
ncbi:MAG: hypothetical protein ACRD3C_05555, partial [Vicinamibacterales bacterium]